MKNRTVTICKWISLSVIAVSLLYVVLLGLANRSLRQAYAALEAGGRPMTVEELLPRDIQDVENAALIYKAAVLRLKAEEGAGGQDLFSELGNLADRVLEKTPDDQALDSFRHNLNMQTVSETFATLEKAKGRTKCRFIVDYSEGAGTPLPHLSDVRILTKIACARARTQALDGDVAESWDSVGTALHLANALKKEPLLISQLVRVAQFSVTADTLQVLANLSTPSETHYNAIKHLLHEFDDLTPLASAMDGERLLLGEWAFNLPPSERDELQTLVESESQALLSLIAFFRPRFLRDHAAYLRVMHSYAQNATEPYSPHNESFGEELMNNVPTYSFLTRILVPPMSSVKNRYMSMIAKARVTLAGLTVQQARHKKGASPATLNALETKIPVDPFTGEALIYRSTPSGFIVYSVGENLTDGGGTLSSEDVEGDIVWQNEL